VRNGSKSLSVLLTPTAPTTPYSSVPHGDFKYVGYTGVYNVVDYSAVSFPTGLAVDKTKDKPVQGSEAQSEYCKATRDSCKCFEGVHAKFY
jgi:amidase